MASLICSGGTSNPLESFLLCQSLVGAEFCSMFLISSSLTLLLHRSAGRNGENNHAGHQYIVISITEWEDKLKRGCKYFDIGLDSNLFFLAKGTSMNTIGQPFQQLSPPVAAHRRKVPDVVVGISTLRTHFSRWTDRVGRLPWDEEWWWWCWWCWENSTPSNEMQL